MIEAAMGGCLVAITFAVIERGKDRGIDTLQSFIFVIVPFLMSNVLVWIFWFAGLPEHNLIPFLVLLLYFLVPALMLRFQFELSWQRSLAYGGIVHVAIVASMFIISYGLAALSGY